MSCHSVAVIITDITNISYGKSQAAIQYVLDEDEMLRLIRTVPPISRQKMYSHKHAKLSCVPQLQYGCFVLENIPAPQLQVVQSYCWTKFEFVGKSSVYTHNTSQQTFNLK